MPKPRPLSDVEARTALARRFAPRADRLRQFATRFGLRSRRVFLVWEQWTGTERGEGTRSTLARVELLPTPRVGDLSAVMRRAFATGTLDDGALRIDMISVAVFSEDNLRGLRIPATQGYPGGVVGGTPDEPVIARNVDFWWEMTEDAGGDEPPARRRFRVSGGPWRNEGGLYWAVAVEAAGDGRQRDGDEFFDDGVV